MRVRCRGGVGRIRSSALVGEDGDEARGVRRKSGMTRTEAPYLTVEESKILRPYKNGLLCPDLAAETDEAEQDCGDDRARDVREEIVQAGVAVGDDELEQFNAAADARCQEQDGRQGQSQAPAQEQRDGEGGRKVEGLVHGRYGQEMQRRAVQGRVCRDGCQGDEGEAEGFLKSGSHNGGTMLRGRKKQAPSRHRQA